MSELPFSRLNEIYSGQEFKHYHILEQIGEGGQGCVWSALDKKNNQVVAIKFSETPESNVKKTPDDLLLEKQISKLMQMRHPYILPMMDFGASSLMRYLVSPYIPGGSLEDIIDKGPQPFQDALAYAAKIAAALDYLHEQEIIHRDLKPSNILVDLHHNIYLSDFGLARVLSDSTQAMHTGRGTPFYAPPEQHTMSEATARSDVYSFGILVYELLTGQLPWQGDKVLGVQQLQTKETMPDPREIIPDLPERLVSVLSKITETVPAARPDSAGKAMELLYDAFNMAPLVIASPKDWDVTAIQNLNALEIYQQSVSRWHSLKSTIPLTLTAFAMIDSSQQTEQARQVTPQFMLSTAITYGFHHEKWWQNISSQEDRLAVATHLLQDEHEATRQRVARMIVEDERLRTQKFSPDDDFIKAVVKAIGLTEDGKTRRSLIPFLIEVLPAGKKWHEIVIGQKEDALLAYQALENSPAGNQAAQLIGHLRAEKALTTVFKTARPSRQLPALLSTLQAAGNLPASIPPYNRLETLAEWILAQAFTAPNRLTLLALQVLLGTALGFGIYTYSVYRLAAILDTARFLTATQHGFFIGSGFALSVLFIRITVERFPQLPAWKRLIAACLPGGLIFAIVFLLYHSLLLERYELLDPGRLNQSSLFLAGCWVIALGFALGSLARHRIIKMLTAATGIVAALFGTWWAHLHLAVSPFPMLYYEYTWPVSQVLILIFLIATPTALSAYLINLNQRATRPAAQPNRP